MILKICFSEVLSWLGNSRCTISAVIALVCKLGWFYRELGEFINMGVVVVYLKFLRGEGDWRRYFQW